MIPFGHFMLDLFLLTYSHSHSIFSTWKCVSDCLSLSFSDSGSSGFSNFTGKVERTLCEKGKEIAEKIGGKERGKENELKKKEMR